MFLLPLKNVVNDICESMDDMRHVKAMKVLKTVVRKMQHFNYFHETPYPITVKLPVSSIHTVNMPFDCIEPTKVGLCIGGRIHSFYYNHDLCNPGKEPCCTCPTTDPIPEESICDFCRFPNYSSESGTASFSEHYAVRPYQTLAGFFNYDLYNERIVFDPNSNVQPGDEIVLVYKSAMQFKGGVAVIPVEFFEYCRYGVLEEMGDRRERQYNKNEFEKQERKIIRKYNRMTAEEWEAAISNAKISTVKR